MKLVIFISAVLCTILCFYTPPIKAYALEGEYGMVASDNVYLHLTSDLKADSRVFLLERTYFVKVIKKEDSYYEVSYAFDSKEYSEITGYVSASDILLAVPKTPPYHFSKKLEKIGNPILFTDKAMEANNSTTIMSDDVYYYGKITTGTNTLYFVRYLRKVGYVDASSFSTFSISTHPDYTPPTPPVTDPTPDKNGGSTQISDTSNGATIEIILIVAICVPSIIIVFLLFRSPKKPSTKHTDIYHRENYPPYDRDNYKD